MYKNVVFYENECVPVYVTSSSYKMMTSLLQLCTYILIRFFLFFFFTINYKFTSDQDKKM